MATRTRAGASIWSGLSEGVTVLVDTAPWIYLLEDHAEFAPRFWGLFEAAERGQIQLALSTVTGVIGRLKHSPSIKCLKIEIVACCTIPA